MAKCFTSVCLISIVLLVSEARPLKPRNPITKGVEIFFDGLYIEGIKTGGSSPRGEGHSFTNTQTLEANDSAGGPSAGGNGHAFTNARTLEAKDSGPSDGGEGHAFTNAQTLEAKDSGPSSGGEGH